MSAAHLTPALRGVAGAVLVATLVASPASKAQTAAEAPANATASAPANGDASFVLKGVIYRGSTEVHKRALSDIAATYIGRRVTLADLEQLAARVTQEYRSRGFFLAQAVVPQQQIKDGQAEISVLEGRLGKVQLRVAADAPISEERVRAIVSQLPAGAPLQQAAYERTMLLLSDLPGLRVQAGLEQGVETGTTDLVVDVAAAEHRWQASVDADNYGTQASGRERFSATVRYASPFGIGDNIDARLMSTSGAHQTFGRLSYEAPLAANGLRLGVGVSQVGYELGEPYAALGATGTALVYDGSLAYPLLRSRARNLFVRATIESKTLRDKTAAVGIDSDKRVNATSLSLNWEARDGLFGGGYVSAGATGYTGRLVINDALTRGVDQDPLNGHQTEGRYSKFNVQASRLQTLFGRHNLYLSVAGQLASRNLDASEKLALGGDRAVRAYPSGELLVDTGWLGTVEWRYSVTDALVFALFYDAASGRQAKSPNLLDVSNRRSLRGPGVGLSWNAPWAITVRSSVAWRNTEPALSDGGGSDPRVLVQVQKAF